MMRLILSVASALTVAAPMLANAQSYAFSEASHGGSAVSISESHGQGSSVANSSAMGGNAFAHQRSFGHGGGQAHGVATANTVGGSATALGHVEAFGPCADARGVTTASSHFGAAHATGESYAGPFGQSTVHSTALSDFGNSHSAGYGNAVGGTTYSESVSHSFGPLTISRSIGSATGGYDGGAQSRSYSVGIGFSYPVTAHAEAHSRAMPGSQARSAASHFVYGR